jgi:hypothetical protein
MVVIVDFNKATCALTPLIGRNLLLYQQQTLAHKLQLPQLMPYKYQEEISALNLVLINCPCGTDRTTTAYRFVHLPQDGSRNFLPRKYEGGPMKKIAQSDPPTDQEERHAEITKCEYWGLSFYETEEAARKAFKKVKKYLTHTHIAAVSIIPSDGCCSSTEPATQHFNLYEYTTANLPAHVRHSVAI